MDCHVADAPRNDKKSVLDGSKIIKSPSSREFA